MKLVAQYLFLPAVGLAIGVGSVFSSEVAFAAASGTVLFFLLILLGSNRSP